MKKIILLCCTLVLTATIWSCQTTKKEPPAEPVPTMSLPGFVGNHLSSNGSTDSVSLQQMQSLDQELKSQFNPDKPKPGYTMMACCLPCVVACCVCGPKDSIRFSANKQFQSLELIPADKGEAVKSSENKTDSLTVFTFGIKDVEGDFTLRIKGDFPSGEISIPVRVEKQMLMLRAPVAPVKEK